MNSTHPHIDAVLMSLVNGFYDVQLFMGTIGGVMTQRMQRFPLVQAKVNMNIAAEELKQDDAEHIKCLKGGSVRGFPDPRGRYMNLYKNYDMLRTI